LQDLLLQADRVEVYDIDRNDLGGGRLQPAACR
jgi:hypothetical protein